MSETKTCPRCGTPRRPDETPAGLCAACLMKMGFDSHSGAAEVVLSESERTERAPAPTIAELAPHFPELEIVELVGRGGMGAVYRAKQRSLDRDVALKILTVPAGDATFADRFQREARTLATLSHPGITAVFDFGQRGPWSFLAMEFVEGASLRQMLRARALGSRESLAIVSQMCDALQYAHDKGVVHRDIKPENVLVTRDGRVKVLDFGLAKLVGTAQRDNLTQARQVMGTPHYMAPEQWEKPLTVDHRADIYAMGVVFYELLTGELPIGRFAPPSHKVAVDVRLDDVVLRSLEKEPDRRYQHASQVKDEVAGITSTPGGAPPPIPTVPERKRFPYKSLIAGVIIGSLVLLLFPASLIVFSLWGIPEELPAESIVQVTPTAIDSRGDTSGVLTEGTSLSSLRVTSELAQAIDIQLQDVPRLNDELAQIWLRYMSSEPRCVTCTWTPEGRLHVKARPDPERLVSALRSEALKAVLRFITRAHPISVQNKEHLRRRINDQLRFGASSEQFDLEFEVDEAVLRGTDGTILRRVLASDPVSIAYRRLWANAQHQRQSK